MFTLLPYKKIKIFADLTILELKKIFWADYTVNLIGDIVHVTQNIPTNSPKYWFFKSKIVWKIKKSDSWKNEIDFTITGNLISILLCLGIGFDIINKILSKNFVLERDWKELLGLMLFYLFMILFINKEINIIQKYIKTFPSK